VLLCLSVAAVILDALDSPVYGVDAVGHYGAHSWERVSDSRRRGVLFSPAGGTGTAARADPSSPKTVSLVSLQWRVGLVIL